MRYVHLDLIQMAFALTGSCVLIYNIDTWSEWLYNFLLNNL